MVKIVLTMGHQKNNKGFTVVELLIVVVVIAILAAITIVAFSGIQERAKQSASQSAAAQTAKKIAIWQADYPNQSPDLAQFTNLVGSDVISSYQHSPGSNGAYCFTFTKANVSYYASASQQTPVAGACAGHGANGVVAITNLAPNPSIETTTNSYGLNTATPTVDTSWAQNGSASLRITPTAATNDTFANIGGDLGGLRLGMEAGKTYTASGTIRLAGAQTGTLGGVARRLTAWYTVAGVHTSVLSAPASNAAGVTRLSVTFSIPANATAAWLRLYNGASVGNGDVWWDSIMLTEGST